MRLFHFEVIKMLRRARTYLSLGLMLVLVVLIFWGLKSEGEHALKYILKALDKNFIFNGNILNGYLVTYIVLNTLWIHIPVLIIIVTGDLFSSELEGGTIRILLTRPVKRYKLVLIKHLTAIFFVLIFMLLWGFITLIPSKILFGTGDLVVVMNGLQILEEKDLLWRFVSAFGFAFIGMGTLAIFSVSISFFTRKSLLSILITLGVLVISTLLQTLAPSVFQGWESVLITYHLTQWQQFFQTEIDLQSILISVFWLLGFSLVCIMASMVRFNRLKITE